MEKKSARKLPYKMPIRGDLAVKTGYFVLSKTHPFSFSTGWFVSWTHLLIQSSLFFPRSKKQTSIVCSAIFLSMVGNRCLTMSFWTHKP
jgi:hypothetical protein